MIHVVVPPGTAPMRLDRFLAGHVAGISRRRIREHGAVLQVNGRPARRSSLVRPGDRIIVPTSLVAAPEVSPAPELRLSVLYEDDVVVAIDKPAGLSTVSLGESAESSVAAFLLARFPETRDAGSSPREGGVVHRLDRDTSGVLLAARTASAYAQLRRQFSRRQVTKEYLALVLGDVAEEGRVDTPVAHDRRRPHRMRLCPTRAAQLRWKARPAETLYRPRLRYGPATLLEVRPRTGVMHQIRIHLASLGHPVAADPIYAPAGSPRFGLSRHALHALRLRLRHPQSGRPFTLEAPLPPDLEEALQACAAVTRR